MEKTNLKKRIMRRVYAIWFSRKIAPSLFLQMPLLALIAFRETAREFWVARIFDNFILAFQQGFFATLNYVFSAAINAPFLPSAIIMFSLGLLALVAARIIRNVRYFRQENLLRIPF